MKQRAGLAFLVEKLLQIYWAMLTLVFLWSKKRAKSQTCEIILNSVVMWYSDHHYSGTSQKFISVQMKWLSFVLHSAFQISDCDYGLKATSFVGQPPQDESRKADKLLPVTMRKYVSNDPTYSSHTAFLCYLILPDLPWLQARPNDKFFRYFQILLSFARRTQIWCATECPHYKPYHVPHVAMNRPKNNKKFRLWNGPLSFCGTTGATIANDWIRALQNPWAALHIL